jgi:hypothetical protein
LTLVDTQTLPLRPFPSAQPARFTVTPHIRGGEAPSTHHVRGMDAAPTRH